jgi:hypothetical protein
MRAGITQVDPSTDSSTGSILCPDGYNIKREFVSAASLEMANLFDKDRNFGYNNKILCGSKLKW